jgi:hypothetical protein
MIFGPQGEPIPETPEEFLLPKGPQGEPLIVLPWQEEEEEADD